MANCFELIMNGVMIKATIVCRETVAMSLKFYCNYPADLQSPRSDVTTALILAVFLQYTVDTPFWVLHTCKQ